jgi:hypothetical protein
VLGAVRRSLVYRDVRESVKTFSKNHDFLREMIDDLKYFRVTKDDELSDILDELNAI